MKYLSLCSGIEAATVAWHGLGWDPVFFSEIDSFPCAVLAHHYPNVPNLGDMTKFKEWPDATIDVLVGGTPCQSFSVAGLRKGLDDPRGNLMLTYLAIADRYRPQWLVWENVPGVLSSNGGRDFGTFLGGLGQLGYGFAYRVLDAQFFGVPQRRRRVFVVGYLGDWRRAAAVLFERHSLSGNPAPSRKERKDVAATLKGGSGDRGWNVDDGAPLVPTQPVAALTATGCGTCGADDNQAQAGHLIPVVDSGCTDTLICMATGQGSAEIVSDGSPSLTCNHEAPIIVHGTQDPCTSDIAFAQGRNNGGENVVCFGGDVARTLSARHDSSPCADRGMDVIATQMQVRRLTPVEAERLQGFPDGYTNIPWRGKPESPDGPRYKALGNSMAVPVMRWIGERIEAVFYV